jgi:hypothetical protein
MAPFTAGLLAFIASFYFAMAMVYGLGFTIVL